MYRRKRFLSFTFFVRPSRRASRSQDGIVRSSILYGAYLLFVLVAFRSDLGRCFSGIGYDHPPPPLLFFPLTLSASSSSSSPPLSVSVAVPEFARCDAGGCNFEGANVRYSSFHFGGCFAVPFSSGK